MSKPNSKLRRLYYDIAGFGLILAGLLFGWLPGPGGIPLILAGLALLANNHHWAKQVLEQAQEHGANLSRILFPKNRLVQALYDLVGLAMIIFAGYMAIYHYNRIIGLFVTATLFFGISILTLNRQRLQRLQKWYRKRKIK